MDKLPERWALIENAPKDGTFVIAASESRLPIFRFPYPLRQRWNGANWEADDGKVYSPQPTHYLEALDDDENQP